MINFYIIIPTHNRNEILNETILSVIKQSYPQWKMLISDNASKEPVADTIPKSYLEDSRVEIIRRNDLISTGTEHIELLLHESLNIDYKYDYLLILADDDILLPFALETIEKYFNKQPFIGCSFVSYYQKLGIITYENFLENNHNYSLEVNSLDLIEYFTKNQGIILNNKLKNESKNFTIGPTHVSTYFISKKILQETLEKYGKISVDPFGDVGYGKFALLSGSVFYLTIPIAIIRFNDNYGMTGSLPGQRHSIAKHHDITIRYSPVKGITFANCSLESYLSLLNEIKIDYKDNINIKFYLLHLLEILRDKPYNKTTLNDLKEVMPFLLSLPRFFEAFVLLLKYSYRKCFNRNVNIKKEKVNSVWDAVDFCEKEFNIHKK